MTGVFRYFWRKARPGLKPPHIEPMVIVSEPTDDEIRAAQVAHWFLDKPEDFTETGFLTYKNKKAKILLYFDVVKTFNREKKDWEVVGYEARVSFTGRPRTIFNEGQITVSLGGDLAEAGYNQCKAIDKKRHKEYMDKNWPLPIYPKPTKRKSK